MKKILFIMPFTIPVTELIGDNTGNYVYYLAVYSYLFGMDNVTCMGIDEIQKHLADDAEWIKKHFDIAIMAEANLFATCYKNTALVDNANLIKSLQIPVFVIGIGCQNNIDNSVENLASIHDEVKNYVDTILSSGGMLTLRGHLTGDYLKSLGYNNIPVFGCPSMYINGLSFGISDDKVPLSQFKPMFNAKSVEDLNSKLYDDYPQSAFFDQDRYLKSLFTPSLAKNDACLQNDVFIKLYKQGRIRGDINYWPWKKQILDGGFNFGYGSRIHGNIIAIQSGIPAFVKVIDSRTREIAEFYGIPNSLEQPFDEGKDTLYDLYKSISFEKFNANYQKKYNDFKNFLVKISGIKSEQDDKYIAENGANFMTFLESKKYPTYDSNYAETPAGRELIEYLETNKHKWGLGRMFKKTKKSDKKSQNVSKPKITVIMACYNSAEFVGKSIQSVMNQTYQNWELLCINDMSTDNTLDVLNEYAKKDSRIKVFDKTEKGGKAAPNYNFAIDRATGDFMCLVDHDDTISPDMFEEEIKRQKETGADIIIPDCMLVFPDEPEKNWTMAGIVDAWGKDNKKVNRDIILSKRGAVELSLNWRISGFNLVRSSIMRKCKYCEEGMNGDEYSARVFYLYADKIAFSKGTYYYNQISSSITKKLTPKLWDVYKTPYYLEKLLIDNKFSYDLMSSMQSSRESLYKQLVERYEQNKADLNKDEQTQIEALLTDNERLLKEIDISMYKPKKSFWHKIFSYKKNVDKVAIRILGFIKIKYRTKRI